MIKYYKSLMPFCNPPEKPKIDYDFVLFLNCILAVYIIYSLIAMKTFNLIGVCIGFFENSRIGFSDDIDFIKENGGFFISGMDRGYLFKSNILIYLIVILFLYGCRRKANS